MNNTNPYPIVPAIIPDSAEAVQAAAQTLRFAREFHLDLIDGQFVPTVSWPYAPAGEPAAVAAPLAAYTLEVDLMVADPLPAATAWVEAGADMLVFHVETVALADLKTFVAAHAVTIGVSAHGDTPLETLVAYAVVADYVQLMGIREIGAQGQPFDERVLTWIAALRTACPGKLISVDGSVNESTIGRLRDAGAERFVCGSAIVGQPDPQAAYAQLQEALANR